MGKSKKIGDFYDDWKVMRRHKVKYFLIRSVLLYGVPLWVIVYFISLASGTRFYEGSAPVWLAVFCVGGFAYTWFEWTYNERLFHKKEKEKSVQGSLDTDGN